MDLPVQLSPSLTLLSILLAVGVAAIAFRKPLAAAFKRRRTLPVGYGYGYAAHFAVGQGVTDVKNVCINGAPYVPAERLESALARLAAIRAYKAQVTPSAAKPVSANEGGQP